MVARPLFMEIQRALRIVPESFYDGVRERWSRGALSLRKLHRCSGAARPTKSVRIPKESVRSGRGRLCPEN